MYVLGKRFLDVLASLDFKLSVSQSGLWGGKDIDKKKLVNISSEI